MAVIQLTYGEIRNRVQQKNPAVPLATTDNLSSVTQLQIQAQQTEPIFIEIDAFRPQDGFTTEARTDAQIEEILGINTTTQENTYQGKQILINSGRIILNSYDDYLMLFSSNGIAVSSKGTFNVDTDEEITLFGDQGLFLGVPNKGQPYAAPTPPQPTPTPEPSGEPVQPQTGTGTAADPIKVGVNNTEEDTSLLTQRDLAKAELSTLNDERNVATADRDYDPLILGNKLADWLSDLVLAIQTLQINTPAGPGYISAGDSQYNLKKLNARIPEMISTFAFVDGRSHLKVDDPGPPPPPDPNDNASGNLTVDLTGGTLPNDSFEGIDENNLEILPNTVGVKTNNGTIPPELIILPGKQPALRQTAIAFIAMAKAAKEEAGLNLSVVSGFRPAFGPNLTAQTNKGRTITITTQETLRRQRNRWSGRSSWSGDDESFVLEAGSSKFSPQTAPPGKSNHGNGTALDLNTGTKDSGTLNIAIYTWLCKNSYRFGFVRAVRTEEWHFEYIGTSAATGPYAKVSGTNQNRFYSELGLDKLA
jgi:hypothetical protein